MSPGVIAIIVSVVIIIIIALVLVLTITNYESNKDTSTGLRFGILMSALFVSALANVMGDLYINFLYKAINTNSSTIMQGRGSF